MARVLSIETSGSICSVAIIENQCVVEIISTEEPNVHSKKLAVFIQDIFKKTNLNPSDIDVVAVSEGPGSYTGLRIGFSLAKGLCYALDKPIVLVPTLKAIAFEMKKQISQSESLIIPMIDARRMEVYSAIYDCNLNETKSPWAEILTENSFLEYKNSKVFYAGDGAHKFMNINKLDNFHYLKNIQLTAESIGILGEKEFLKGNTNDVAYCEPFYLKEFKAGSPKVKGL